MKYLIIILTIILFSCQKQETIKVTYSLSHSGDGMLEYKFDSQTEYRELNNTTFDTTFILPVLSYNYQLKIHIKHYNKVNNFSNIKAYIIIDGVIEDSLVRAFNSCYSIKRTLSYYE